MIYDENAFESERDGADDRANRGTPASSPKRKESMKNETTKFPEVNGKTRTVLGKECWTPKQAAEAVGVNRNTILNWARKTKKGELDMPLLSAPIKRSEVFVPIDEFLDWYSYGCQN